MFRAAMLILIATAAFADSEVGRSFRKSVPASGVEHVLVDISVGEVEIRSGTSRNIEVSGSIRREYDSARGRKRAEQIVANTDVEVLIRGDRATIREKKGPAARSGTGRWVHSEIEVHITLPAGVNLEVEQNIGELKIAGDFRDLEVEMTIGELSVRLPKRNVRELSAAARIGEVHADLGDRTVTKEGILAGRTRYENTAGIGIVDLSLGIGELDVALE